MIKISTPNIQTVIKQLKAKQKEIQTKTWELAETVAEKGNEKLAEKLDNAQYDGSATRYVSPTEFDQASGKLSIGIGGEAVTFIEFGTGTHYEGDHPLMSEFGFTRGTFGRGLGSSPPWFFRETSGAVGRNFIGEVDGVTRGGALIIKTYGNPANRVVYDTGKELREETGDIAKEVFSK